MKSYLIIILTALTLLASCKKYPEGPSVSLSSKKSRLANKWMVEQYLLNGVDNTYNYRTIITSETLEIFKSGTWQSTEASSWNWAKPYDTGKWNLIDKKEDLEIISNSPGVPYKLFKILRLKSTQLWVQRQVNADSLVEIHYVPQTNVQ